MTIQYDLVQVVCIGCGDTFETDNEDDMVMQICPDCLDGNIDHDISYSDCDLF